jgi:hypothetical protein
MPGGRSSATVRAMALRSLLDGPTPPRVRADALESTFVVRRDDGGRTTLLRLRGGEEAELAVSRRRGGPSWARLAQALLADALDGPAPRRLVSDYARFLVTPRGQTRAIGGTDLGLWLETWRPSILATLAARR